MQCLSTIGGRYFAVAAIGYQAVFCQSFNSTIHLLIGNNDDAKHYSPTLKEAVEVYLLLKGDEDCKACSCWKRLGNKGIFWVNYSPG